MNAQVIRRGVKLEMHLRNIKFLFGRPRFRACCPAIRAIITATKPGTTSWNDDREPSGLRSRVPCFVSIAFTSFCA
jgi:hypothetical protein